MGASIAAVGYYLPKRLVDNEELLTMIIQASQCSQESLDDLRKKLILNKAATRYFRSPAEDSLYMSEMAARNSLEKAKVKPEDVDLLIYGAMHRECLEPAMSIMLCDRLHTINANAFDMSNACNSFLNMMEVACDYIELGKYRNVLIVGVEMGSDWIPFEYFGIDKSITGFSSLTVSDGAASMILQPGGNEKSFQHFFFKIYSQYNDLCRIKIGKGPEDMRLLVKSRQLAMAAMEIMPKCTPEYVNAAHDHLGGLDILFFHQITGDQRRLAGSLSDELYAKAYNTFTTVGNTGSISIPLGMALAEEEGKLRRGDRVAVVVGASGFSCGSTSFVY